MMAPKEDTRPTTWSFVPAGVIAVVAFAFSVVWSEDGRNPADEVESGWSLLLFALHFIAVLGCARGSVLFLWRRDPSGPRLHFWLAVGCLILIATYAMGIAGLFVYIRHLSEASRA